jgi:hypothetical protein
MLARELEAFEQTSPDLDSSLDNTISDDLLRFVFIACHPILPTEPRAALTLRLLGGLTIDGIARAFLTPEPTVAQRIVRAKRTLADKHIPFEVPRGPELAARLSSVLEVIYLVFNEGYLPLPATTLCAAPSAKTRSASAASSPNSLPPNRKSTAWSPYGDPGLPHPRPHHLHRRTSLTLRSKPHPMGSTPHLSRTNRNRTCS